MSSIELVLEEYFIQAKDELRSAAPPLYFIVYSAILRAILEGNLAPGESMPSLKKLSKLFNVSLTTVIAAVRLLADEGLVHPRTGKGVYVLPHTENAV